MAEAGQGSGLEWPVIPDGAEYDLIWSAEIRYDRAMLDLGQIREKFPEWSVTAVWTARANGPDFRRLFAWCDGETVSADNEAELEAKLERAQKKAGPP